MEPRSEEKLKPTRWEEPEEPVSLEPFFERMESARFLVAYMSDFGVYVVISVVTGDLHIVYWSLAATLIRASIGPV